MGFVVFIWGKKKSDKREGSFFFISTRGNMLMEIKDHIVCEWKWTIRCPSHSHCYESGTLCLLGTTTYLIHACNSWLGIWSLAFPFVDSSIALRVIFHCSSPPSLTNLSSYTSSSNYMDYLLLFPFCSIGLLAAPLLVGGGTLCVGYMRP